MYLRNEKCHQFSDGSSSVGNLVFDGLAQFGKCLIIAFWDKDSIIVEAFRATPLKGYTSIYFSAEKVLARWCRWIVNASYQCNDGAESRLSVVIIS